RAGVFEVEYADDLAFVDKRYGHFRARLGVDLNIARVLADIADADEAMGSDGGADEANVEGKFFLRVEALAEAKGKAVFKYTLVFVDEPDGEYLKVDDAA